MTSFQMKRVVLFALLHIHQVLAFTPRYDCAKNSPCNGHYGSCNYKFLHVNPKKYIECAPVPPFHCSEEYCDDDDYEFSYNLCMCEIAHPCEYFNQPCKNSALCIEVGLPQEYVCFCADGWTGKHCESEIPAISSSVYNLGSRRK
ncbi:hypothetical protein CAPTEDRAFT_191402 [Capitella teleta]|uniref:EGF-like domain-containing protein n=1 Tax=Capitella teleta TaxID=283909 RepID=R7T370_CAPTE|nr:hypothetical protein CAPTEDRAFT_191402 [Capitella teleta]|eukprot:ELT87006.1 hypothetical protein CAPTEDRAFT_191402 [Capitella teleta]